MTMRLVKPRPIPLLITLAALITTVSLGVWQVERLAWKEALIERIETANAEAPLTTVPRGDALENNHYRTLTLTGTFVHEKELHMAARYYQSELGYHLFTPLEVTGSDTVVMVNRGWVPTRMKEAETRPQSLVQGPQTVTGMIRLNRERNPFTPPNQPEKNVWFGRDVDEMAAYTALPLEPFTLDAVGEPAEGQPIPGSGELRLRNDHLGYAFTWFAIALSIGVIFVVYHRKPS